MVARSTCLSPFCGARVLKRLQRCPKCGRQMFDDHEIGRRGWHVLQLGMILAGMMGAILWFWWPGLSKAIAGEPRTSFLGTSEDAYWMLLLLVGLMLSGVAFVGSALMMITGRSSRLATCAGVLLFALSLIVIAVILIDAY